MRRIVDLNDGKSWGSLQFLENQRKERRHQVAQMEADEFFDSIKSSVSNFKARVAKEKEPGFNNYPGWLKTYHPSLWCNLSFPPKDWMPTEMLADIVDRKAFLPEAIQSRVDYKLTHGAWYIPSVGYEVILPPPSPHSKGHPAKPGTGVPCLRWQMATYILSTAEFWLTNGKILIERYDFMQSITCELENLGSIYGGPVFWKWQDAFVTPVSLLAKVAGGKAQVPGVEVLKRYSPWTVYAVDGFPDEVVVHDDFHHFIRDMTIKTSLDKALLERGMCDTETAELVKEKLEKLQKPEAPVAVLAISDGKGTETSGDYSNLVEALTHQLGYTNAEAKAAAKHVCGKSPHETLVDKIKIALQYLS